MLPFYYALRNLFRAPARSLQMVLGSFLVVLLIMSAAAFSRGMDISLAACGDPENVMLLAAGSEASTLRSQLNASVPSIVAARIKGIRNVLGKDAVSGEIHYMGQIKDSQGRELATTFRGVRLSALHVHRKVSIREGQFPGTNQVMIGRLAWKQLGVPEQELAVGKTVSFEGNKYPSMASLADGILKKKPIKLKYIQC